MVKQGEIIWLSFDPQAGNEQKGYRPALVISNSDFHAITSNRNAMVCPITNTDRKFSLHVKLDNSTQTTGFIMCEQVKILDISVRSYERKEFIPNEILLKVLEIVQAITIHQSLLELEF